MGCMAMRFTLFDTPIGACALVWGERGLVGASLPERSTAATRARVLQRFRGAHEVEAAPGVLPVVERFRRLLRGEADDLTDIALDMTGVPAFNQRVYGVARAIRSGCTLSYGEVAA